MKRQVFILIASSLAVAGCSREVQELRDVTAPTVCNVTDSDGRFYEATNIEPLDALDAAISRCSLAARDPTTCQQVACVQRSEIHTSLDGEDPITKKARQAPT